jgi:hypothetical protein
LIAYRTGTNDKLFAQTLILLQSLEEVGAQRLLKVCDFGLSEGERRFLESRGQLAVADPPVPPKLSHPWYHKAALQDFADPEAEAIVWLDADMIMTADPRPVVEAILAEMRREGHALATTQDVIGLSLGDTIRRIAAAHENSRPFLRLLEEHGISEDHPYLNSGFFIAGSRAMLQEWKRITFEGPMYFLFEQNAYNVAAWREPGRVRILDRRTWNVCGQDLDAIVFNGEGGEVLCQGRPAIALHATDIGYSQTEMIAKTIVLPGCRLSSKLKALRNPRLRAVQIGLFERFVSQNGDALAELL